MCPCRLERVSWSLDASVSAMIAYDLIFGAAAFAGLGAGVSDLFSHIEQIDSGLPADRGRIMLRDRTSVKASASVRIQFLHRVINFSCPYPLRAAILPYCIVHMILPIPFRVSASSLL